MYIKLYLYYICSVLKFTSLYMYRCFACTNFYCSMCVQGQWREMPEEGSRSSGTELGCQPPGHRPEDLYKSSQCALKCRVISSASACVLKTLPHMSTLKGHGKESAERNYISLHTWFLKIRINNSEAGRTAEFWSFDCWMMYHCNFKKQTNKQNFFWSLGILKHWLKK